MDLSDINGVIGKCHIRLCIGIINTNYEASELIYGKKGDLEIACYECKHAAKYVGENLCDEYKYVYTLINNFNNEPISSLIAYIYNVTSCGIHLFTKTSYSGLGFDLNIICYCFHSHSDIK